MKTIKILALLAFAILAGCTKDKDLTSVPNPPPDTKDYNTIPLGAVQAPYVIIKYVDWNNDLRIIKVNTDGSAYTPVSNPKWSSYALGGDKMVYLEDNAVYVYDFETQNQVKLFENDLGINPNLAISANGSKVAFVTYDAMLLVMETGQNGRPIEVKGLDITTRYAVQNLAFSPDACHLAFIENNQLLLADLTTLVRDDYEESDPGSYRSILISEPSGTPESEGDHFPVFTSDCQNIVYVSDRYTPFGPGDLAMVSLEQGAENNQVRLTNLFPQGLSNPAYPSVTGEGNDIYFMAKNAQSVYGIYRVSLNGGAVAEIAPNVIGPNCNLYGLEFIEH